MPEPLEHLPGLVGTNRRFGRFPPSEYSLVFDFYETAGFWTDELEKELSSKNEAELIEMFCAI